MKTESEKVLEKKLREKAKALGGWAIKIPALHVSGIPDRLCLLPGGVIIFVELKTTGQKPTKLQIHMHEKLKRLGFDVEVVDSSEKLDAILLLKRT